MLFLHFFVFAKNNTQEELQACRPFLIGAKDTSFVLISSFVHIISSDPYPDIHTVLPKALVLIFCQGWMVLKNYFTNWFSNLIFEHKGDSSCYRKLQKANGLQAFVGF